MPTLSSNSMWETQDGSLDEAAGQPSAFECALLIIMWVW